MIEKKVFEKIDVLSKYKLILNQINPLKPSGRVEKVSGFAIYSKGPEVKIGEICRILTEKEEVYVNCEVVGFDKDNIILMPMGSLQGVFTGATILATGRPLMVPLDDNLIGRVLDGTGEPIDGKGAIFAPEYKTIDRDPPNAHNRPMINKVLSTGVKCVDGLLTVGRGQRIGIFAGAGVGKSSLLGMIARYTDADINVIALVGERGRELPEFIENDLGKDGLKKSVVIVATSDKPAVHKIACALTATTIAEYFRDKGLHVNLMMDSLTRFAMAQREIGASVREPVITRGYPPSVFTKLSRLVERAGTSSSGSITGLYTILVDADDMNEPVSDAVRGFLDGHIVLNRKLAQENHYPAIDILDSISRVMPRIIDTEHAKYAEFIRKHMAFYKKEDFIKIGTYSPGSIPEVDVALRIIDAVNEFLIQSIDVKSTFENTLEIMKEIYYSVNRDDREYLEEF